MLDAPFYFFNFCDASELSVLRNPAVMFFMIMTVTPPEIFRDLNRGDNCTVSNYCF